MFFHINLIKKIFSTNKRYEIVLKNDKINIIKEKHGNNHDSFKKNIKKSPWPKV